MTQVIVKNITRKEDTRVIPWLKTRFGETVEIN